MGFLPYDAPAPAERAFENIARCTTNRIISLGEAVGLKGRLNKLPEGGNPAAPYWDLVFETLDAKYSDGNSLAIVDSTKLTDKNGEWLDNTQRPYLIAQAFAGLGIRSVPFTAEVAARFPGFDMGIDPDYDESLIVGRSFRLRQKTLKNRAGEAIGRDIYLPIEAFDADFVYTGTVRTVVSSQSNGVATDGNGVAAAAVAQTIDIVSNADVRAQVVSAVAGSVADDDTVMRVLRSADLGNLSVNGTRFLELVADDRLVASLVDAGFVTVSDGTLVAV